MEAVLRGLAIYLALLFIVRIYGRRTIGQITTFDFVLLLIVAEATQNALLRNDYSVTNSILIVLTLFTVDGILSFWKHGSNRAQEILEGVPILLLRDGRPIQAVMDSVQIDEQDILSAARELRGISRLDQIRYAVLEIDGTITIVPAREALPPAQAA